MMKFLEKCRILHYYTIYFIKSNFYLWLNSKQHKSDTKQGIIYVQKYKWNVKSCVSQEKSYNNVKLWSGSGLDGETKPSKSV